MKYDKHFLDTCRKLGDNIQKFREKKQMTIKELSEKTGIRKEYLRKIENGKAYGVLFDKHLLKIAIDLNTKISDLFDFD